MSKLLFKSFDDAEELTEFCNNYTPHFEIRIKSNLIAYGKQKVKVEGITQEGLMYTLFYRVIEFDTKIKNVGKDVQV